jgi:hypothetical protein
MSPDLDPRQNRLLAALPAQHLARWLPTREPVDMPLGAALCESGFAMSDVCFPCTSIVSLLYVMEDGASAEIAVVGNEGRHELLPSRWQAQHSHRSRRSRGVAPVRHTQRAPYAPAKRSQGQIGLGYENAPLSGAF